MIVAVSIVAGLALARLLGADLARLADVRLRAAWLVFAALAVQVAIFSPFSPSLPGGAEVGLHLGSYGLLLLFLAVNLHLRGLWVAAAGFGCNALAILVNGGRMPVAASAWEGGDGAYNNVALAGDGTRLRWLGDVVPLPDWLPLASALSVGDLLLVAGMTLFVYRTCGARARRAPSVAAR